MKFTCVGDALIQRRIPENSPSVAELEPFIRRGDARFFNLETTLNKEGTCPGNQFSGGTYIRADQKVFQDVLGYGFNMTTFNNNHAFDFTLQGAYDTLDVLEQSGIVHAGFGENIDEAAAPAFLETNNGRVALISINTSFQACTMAGRQSRYYPGRPGINGVTVKTSYMVSKEDADFIAQLAERTGANYKNTSNRANGYMPPLPEGEAEFGDMRFVVGPEEKIIYTPDKKDMERIRAAISEAQFQADYVVISIHTHQIEGTKTENTPEFLKTMAHTFLDEGADAIICHGPHLLRGIEVYNEKPVFYSLGDFIIELYSVKSAPQEFYDKVKVDAGATCYELLKTRSKDFTRGLMEKPVMLQSVIPYFEMENHKLTKLELMPVEAVRYGNKSEIGLPRFVKEPTFFDSFRELCAEFGTELTLGADGIIQCRW